MRIFVTGATGYVGETLVVHLRDRGHTVTGLTRNTSSTTAGDLLKAGIGMVAGDVGDPSTYREHLVEADVVIHTVTDSTRPGDADRDLFRELSNLREDRTRPHLIYTTGCSVYGAHAFDVLREETPTAPEHPRAALERELRASGLPHTIVRPAFVFGRDGRSSLLGRWLDGTRGDRGVFYGDTTKRWSWVHVDDLARAYAAVVDHLPEVDGGTFLFADEGAPSAFDTFMACHAVSGRGEPVTVEPIENEDELYRIFDRDEVVDASRARNQLGWTPVADTVMAFIEAQRGRGAEPGRGA